jgi:hypothetical protein
MKRLSVPSVNLLITTSDPLPDKTMMGYPFYTIMKNFSST